MELRDYLKLEKQIIPYRYCRTIYEKLKLEMCSELVFGGVTALEDIQEMVRKYNDKWNDIRKEYMNVYQVENPVLQEDWFQEQYLSELQTEESLRKMDDFFA